MAKAKQEKQQCVERCDGENHAVYCKNYVLPKEFDDCEKYCRGIIHVSYCKHYIEPEKKERRTAKNWVHIPGLGNAHPDTADLIRGE